MRTRITMALALVAAALLVGCQTGPAGLKDTSNMTLGRHVTGDDLMGQKDALLTPVVLVNSQKDLDALKSTTLSAQKLDFTKQTLVVLALGEQKTGGCWARLTGAQMAGQTLLVQGVVNRPAKGAMTTQALSYPFDAVVLSKVTATRVIPELKSVEGEDPANADAIAATMPTPPAAPKAAK